MNERDPALERIGDDLRRALARRGLRRRRRRLAATLAGATALAFSAVAAASDNLGLHTFGLDPARFELLGGDRPEPNAEYIYARNRSTGNTDVFVHTRDDGLDRYEAFLLHQRTVRAAAAASSQPAVEPGANCTAEQLTRAEIVALEALAPYEPSEIAPPAQHGPALAAARAAVRNAFGSETCSGLDYGTEIAVSVYAGIEPVENLMPGARP